MQAISQGGIEIMKDELEHVYQDRRNTIAEAVKTNYSGANSLSNLPKEQVYKHVGRYSCAGSDCANTDEAFRIDISQTAAYCVKNGIWQEYLAKTLFKYDVDYFEDIPVINRSKDIFRQHRSDFDEEDGKSTREERLCRYLCSQQKTVFPSITLCDYQVPIKSTSKDTGCGKIDLVGVSDDGEEMVILEYKKPKSHEPFLRAVTEIVTYYRQIDGKNGAKTYLEHFNKTFGLNCTKVRLAVVVPRDMYRTAHRYAFDLIAKYDILCYAWDKNYPPFRSSQTCIERNRKTSEDNMQFVYDHSDDIVARIKND